MDESIWPTFDSKLYKPKCPSYSTGIVQDFMEQFKNQLAQLNFPELCRCWLLINIGQSRTNRFTDERFIKYGFLCMYDTIYWSVPSTDNTKINRFTICYLYSYDECGDSKHSFKTGNNGNKYVHQHLNKLQHVLSGEELVELRDKLEQYVNENYHLIAINNV